MAAVAERLGRVRTFQSLAYPNFRLLWGSIICTGVAFGMDQVALGWLVYQDTDSPLMVGAVQGVRMVPFLVFGPLGGVLADRLDRRRLMLVSNVLTAAFALVLGMLAATNRAQLWQVFVLTSLIGMSFSFSLPVRQALIPSLVSRGHLMNAVALQSTGFQLTSVVAPAVAGLLIGAFNPGAVFLANAVLYALVAILVARIKVPPRTDVEAAEARRESMVANVKQGFAYAAREPVVRTVLLLAMLPVVFGWPVMTLLPVFARDIFHIGASGLGYRNSALGAGALASTVTLASLGNVSRRGWLLMGSCLLMGTGLILLGLTPRWPAGLAFAFIMLTLIGAGRMAFQALLSTIVQLTVPDHLRGRVMSIVTLDLGLTPLGNLLAGAIASASTAGTAVMALGSVVTAGGLYVVAFVRRLRTV
jgi:MFS family permease